MILSVTAPDGVTKLYSNQFFSRTFTDALTLPTTGTYTILLDPEGTLLPRIRVTSKAELKERILAYLEDLNREPVVIAWTYKIDEAA